MKVLKVGTYLKNIVRDLWPFEKGIGSVTKKNGGNLKFCLDLANTYEKELGNLEQAQVTRDPW